MNVTTVRFAFQDEAVDADLAPKKAHTTDAAYDLRAAARKHLMPHETAKIPTGVRIELPPNFVAVVCSRSGMAADGIFVVNAPGIVDQGYRGEIAVILHNLSDWPIEIYKGDRIAQLVVQRLTQVTLELTSSFTDEETERGDAGFGSTGYR